MIDDTLNRRGKGEWTSDNQTTAASSILDNNPAGRPNQRNPARQVGWYRPDGSVETASSPAANNVNLLVETVVLNFMALRGDDSQFANRFPNNGLGNAQLQDSLKLFGPLPGLS